MPLKGERPSLFSCAGECIDLARGHGYRDKYHVHIWDFECEYRRGRGIVDSLITHTLHNLYALVNYTPGHPPGYARYVL